MTFYKLSLAFLLSASALPITASAQAEINGNWKLTAFRCEGGARDKTVSLSEEAVAKGMIEETLRIQNKNVSLRLTQWRTPQKKAGCVSEIQMTWEILPQAYRFVRANPAVTKAIGNATCVTPQVNQSPGREVPFKLSPKELRVIVSSSRSLKKPENPDAEIPCHGGDWIKIYQRAP